MPWPFNTDAHGVSKERNAAIAECARCWSYETPWPDFEKIDRAEADKHLTYKSLRINYDESIDELQSMVERYAAEWMPATDDDGRSFCKTQTINYSFPEYDAFILHCMIRSRKPRRIIELGCGMSTRAMLAATGQNKVESGVDCKVLCVDKYTFEKTKAQLRRSGAEFLEEDIVNISVDVFDTLEAGDILFIDSSHVLKNFGDVEFEFMQVLPRLKAGVVVHVHDIFLPYNYPLNWLLDWKCVLTEQQVLGAYLHDNAKVKILAANHYNLVRGRCVVPQVEYLQGGSFWFECR